MEHRKPEKPGRELSSDEAEVTGGANTDPTLDTPPDTAPGELDSPTWRGWVDWSGE